MGRIVKREPKVDVSMIVWCPVLCIHTSTEFLQVAVQFRIAKQTAVGIDSNQSHLFVVPSVYTRSVHGARASLRTCSRSTERHSYIFYDRGRDRRQKQFCIHYLGVGRRFASCPRSVA
jgi:hypothetical protein